MVVDLFHNVLCLPPYGKVAFINQCCDPSVRLSVPFARWLFGNTVGREHIVSPAILSYCHCHKIVDLLTDFR